MYKYLCKEKREYILSKKVLRSGTGIGALVCEGGYAQSKANFVSTVSISPKEANEILYWLDMLKDTDYILSEMHASIIKRWN